jgi:nucleolar protein 56
MRELSGGENRRELHEAAMKLAKERIAESLAGKDAYLMQAVKALDDLNDAFNIISERLAEWYGIHFPEQHMRPGELIDFILRYGIKEASGDIAVSSIGAPMSEDDVDAVRGLASAARALFEEKKALERYINAAMEELAPNLSKVLGPILGARLIARAGSLEKLAKMPSSGIQVMGAGEALFKHLRAGTPSPKHGLIYKHPLISGAPKRARGKISRMLSGKAAIAARVDYYSGEMTDFGDLKEKAAAIKAKARKKP